MAIIYAGSKNLLREVPVNEIKNFERQYLQTLQKRYPEILQGLKAGKLTDDIIDVLNAVAQETAEQFK